MKIIKEESVNIDLVEQLREGRIIAVPTDTCYGFISNTDADVIERVYRLKRRPKEKHMSLFVSSNWAEDFVEINENGKRLIGKYWPGALTLVVTAKKRKELSAVVAEKGKIAIREPKSDLLLTILNQYRSPIAQTSANVSGKPATYSVEEILEQFDREELKPDYIIDGGALPKKPASTIIDTEDLKVVREGNLKIML